MPSPARRPVSRYATAAQAAAGRSKTGDPVTSATSKTAAAGVFIAPVTRRHRANGKIRGIRGRKAKAHGRRRGQASAQRTERQHRQKNSAGNAAAVAYARKEELDGQKKQQHPNARSGRLGMLNQVHASAERPWEKTARRQAPRQVPPRAGPPAASGGKSPQSPNGFVQQCAKKPRSRAQKQQPGAENPRKFQRRKKRSTGPGPKSVRVSSPAVSAAVAAAARKSTRAHAVLFKDKHRCGQRRAERRRKTRRRARGNQGGFFVLVFGELFGGGLSAPAPSCTDGPPRPSERPNTAPSTPAKNFTGKSAAQRTFRPPPSWAPTWEIPLPTASGWPLSAGPAARPPPQSKKARGR